nr:uncharacterized protein LOC111420776 [Onthophagus taurus]
MQSVWKPPTQLGWLHTLKAFGNIWKDLQSAGLESFRPRYLNQDALENFFGSIRSSCGCNENPTVTQFIGAFKTQVVNGLAKGNLKGTNCEEDSLELLSNFKEFLEIPTLQPIKEEEPTTTSVNELTMQTLPQEVLTTNDIQDLISSGSVHSLSVAYVSGYIVKRISKSFNCDVCMSILTSDDLEPFNAFISAKELSGDTKRLFYPSESLVVTVGLAITEVERILTTYRKCKNITNIGKGIINEKVDFSFLNKCLEHAVYIRAAIITSVCRIGVPWYCTRAVRDMKSAKRQGTNRQRSTFQHI